MSKLILGTVQFGLDYGINNTQGKPEEENVFDILDNAHAAGVQILDTAVAYGNAPKVIGNYHRAKTNRFDVISKFKLAHLATAKQPLAIWLEQHLKELNVPSLWGLMFHAFDDYNGQTELIEELVALKAKGLIQHIGVSLYRNEELSIVTNDPAVDFIQLPYNMLDNNKQRGALLEQANRLGKMIHTRSVFLQGLFFKSLDNIPSKLSPLLPYLKQIKKIEKEHQLSTAELALAYAHANPNIQGVLAGVDSLEQLQANLAALKTPLPLSVVGELDSIDVNNISLLNPSNWL